VLVGGTGHRSGPIVVVASIEADDGSDQLIEPVSEPQVDQGFGSTDRAVSQPSVETVVAG
jgi:hypothetical protein